MDLSRGCSPPTSRQYAYYRPTRDSSRSVGTVTDVVIGSACRTPIGKYGRALRNVEAVKLGSIAIGEAVNRAGIHGSDIDEVIMGNVISAGLGQAPARQAMLLAGLPEVGRAHVCTHVTSL